MKIAVSKLEEKMVVIDLTEKNTDEQLIRANQKKLSILAAAFSGKLIENVEFDESAVELLAKIAKEKALAESKVKLGKRKATIKKAKKMSKRPIIDVLKEANSPLDVDELFEKAGYASDLTSENVEQFYSELKKVVELSNVEVTQEIKSGKKQGDIFIYKA
jgi:type I restriction enzyme S subunit